MFSSTLLRTVQSSRAYDWTMRLSAALYAFYALGSDVSGLYHDAHEWGHADFGTIVAILTRRMLPGLLATIEEGNKAFRISLKIATRSSSCGSPR